jgi:transcriptional regulator with XRE-family HTH domain
MSTEICTNVRFLPQEMQELGKRIRLIRKNTDNCTQAEFAAKYGVSARSLSYIESGDRMPSTEFLYRLRKNNHNLNDLLAPILPEDSNKSEKSVSPTEAELRIKLLSDIFHLPLTAEDMATFTEYCASPATIKVIIQSVLRANKGASVK